MKTIVQSSCGYGPKASSKTARIRGTSRNVRRAMRRGAGRVQDPPDRAVAGRSARRACSSRYGPMCTAARYVAIGTVLSNRQVRGRPAARHVDRAPRRGDGVRGLGRDRDAIARPVVGPVVAGEPRRRADRLRGHERAVLELLPADRAPPRSARARSAGVEDLDRERPRRARAVRPGVTRSLRGPCWKAVRRSPSTRTRVARSPIRSSAIEWVLAAGDGVDDRAALESVGADAVVDVELVRLDVECRIAALRGIVVVMDADHDVDW